MCSYEEGEIRCWGSGNEELYNLDQDGDGFSFWRIVMISMPMRN